MGEELRHTEELSTTVFKIDVPGGDTAMLLNVCANYFNCSDRDLVEFKNKVSRLCRLRSSIEIKGRVGIDVVMLSDDRMSKIICLDVRRAEDDHINMYLCENEDPSVQLIDPSIVKTFELFQAILIEQSNKTLSYYNNLKICAAGANPDSVLQVMGPNGVPLILFDYGSHEACSNCSGYKKHAVHDFKKYSDGNKVKLCVPCCTTLAAVELSDRWTHAYTGVCSNVFDLNPSEDVSESEYLLSVWNKNVTCEGCSKRAIPERMFRCEDQGCSTASKNFCLCTTCMKKVKEKHTFAHKFTEFVSEEENYFSKIVH